jgi:hypothetical protein
MSNDGDNHGSKRRYEIYTDGEEENFQEFSNKKIGLGNQEESQKESTNSTLSTLDENNDKNRSIVWNHFDKFVDNKGVLWAKCRHCG